MIWVVSASSVLISVGHTSQKSLRDIVHGLAPWCTAWLHTWERRTNCVSVYGISESLYGERVFGRKAELGPSTLGPFLLPGCVLASGSDVSVPGSPAWFATVLYMKRYSIVRIVVPSCSCLTAPHRNSSSNSGSTWITIHQVLSILLCTLGIGLWFSNWMSCCVVSFSLPIYC